MPYTIHEEREYERGKTAVYNAAIGAVNGLEGKLLQQDDATGTIKVKFDKKILGKVLGDRTEVNVNISSENENKSQVKVEAYPIDPVGRKMQFGARKGVTRTVITWFFAHFEHRLK